MTIQIISLNKGILKNATHLGVMSDFSAQIAAVNHTKFADAKAKFATALAKEDADFKKASASIYSKQIANADSKRDQAYLRIKKVVAAFEGTDNTNETNAANKIAPVLATYNVDVTAQYDEESALISQLCQELDGADYASAFSALGLTNTYQTLKSANQQMRTLIQSRNQEQSSFAGLDFKADRAATDEAYDEAVAMINAIILYDADNTCKQIASVWNENLNRIRRQITHSGTATLVNGSVVENEPEEEPFDPSDGI